jgi:hypothetical protein
MKMAGCLDSVMISVLAIGPTVHGFKANQGNGFLRARGSKAGGPMLCKILWHVKTTYKYEQKYFARLNSHSFLPLFLLAT